VAQPRTLIAAGHLDPGQPSPGGGAPDPSHGTSKAPSIDPPRSLRETIQRKALLARKPALANGATADSSTIHLAARLERATAAGQSSRPAGRARHREVHTSKSAPPDLEQLSGRPVWPSRSHIPRSVCSRVTMRPHGSRFAVRDLVRTRARDRRARRGSRRATLRARRAGWNCTRNGHARRRGHRRYR
jgi:hypothetical protein